jgi:DivIVA domain-containing protein
LQLNVVRRAIFKANRGGYVESQVDAFIDRVVEILQIEKNR